MSVSATSSSNSSTASEVTSSGYDAFNDVGIEDFLKLMTTELQNQDPLNPMDNAQMLAQIGQIREIASNDSLTKTMESVMLGQNVATASGMLNQTIEAMDDAGVKFTGEVVKVTIADGVPTLNCEEVIPEYVDKTTGKTVAEQTIEHTVKLKNVYGVVPVEEIEKVDPTLLPQQLSTASSLISKTIIAKQGQEVLQETDEDGNVTETRGDTVSGLAGIVEKTVVENGEAKVQILIPAGEVTDENPEPKDKRYVVALSDVEQVLADEEEVDPFRLTEELAIASGMVGREVVGSFTDENGVTGSIAGYVQYAYYQDGKTMLALQQNDNTENLYALALDEVTNVFNYASPYEITETSDNTDPGDGTQTGSSSSDGSI